ncbi:maintenance of mitochondrial structure and function-domain-containing protein [Protomyces lactucae-debilis]|uniref:Maintenance of mitochondrial structure and function-domain-containing protein n=1 Tax=Protomyces lactucae-debilis TaxID=2754530 RepID=A0A1Y2F5I5_PROLT|nr:maintenance of mitochondrial structure and function-domain-containing protein [Protomyces lactucae-debilis]ORY78606.1 maintenance of mitochondrial structure and function-domain-containing protein [Protomyces lactucae-debilis]
MPTATTQETIELASTLVTVHPLVLLSVADSYNRSAAGTKRRVVGVLLGQNNGKTVNVANSFAVPFEEDERDPNVWFLDHNFVESMYDMYRKINAKEKMIGWYHSGPKLKSSDLAISELFKRWIPNPVLLVVDVRPTPGIPTEAYFSVDEIKDDGTSTSRTFVHVSSTIEAEEAEEIGVEHLLRDVRDQSVGSLSTKIADQLRSLQGLSARLGEISTYLEAVLKGELPVNHAILGELQDIFNLLPNLTPADALNATKPNAAKETELSKAFRTNMHDSLMTIYLSSLVRAVMALHDLIDNRKEQGLAKLAGDADRAKESAAIEADIAKEAQESKDKAAKEKQAKEDKGKK